LRNSDHIAFCSCSLLSQMSNYRKINYERVSVIENGVDFEEIEAVAKDTKEEIDQISIVFAGRLIRTKGGLLLLKALSQLGKGSQNISLKIFGKGPLMNELERSIIKYRLERRVRYMGQVSHRKLIAEVKRSDFVVFPSLNEAQPMFILEAMACKKPVLAFNLPFAKELITHMKTGILSKPGDVAELAKGIQLLLSDKNLRSKLGQAAYNYVRANHNWDIQAEKYLRVYDKVKK
jgi:glycosyltransferase involved in cell wall biosynthesis